MERGRGNDLAACPHCGGQLSGWSAIQPGTHPREGDITICLYCEAVLVFRADLTVREPLPRERVAFTRTVQKALAKLNKRRTKP